MTKRAEQLIERHIPDNKRQQSIVIQGPDSFEIAQEIGEVIAILFENRMTKPTIAIQPLLKNDGTNALISTTVSMSRETLLEIQQELGVQHESNVPSKTRRSPKDFRDREEVVDRIQRMEKPRYR